jgi:hypothetical protein
MTNPSRFSLRHLLVAVAVAGGVGMIAPSAEACGGGWWPTVEIDYRVEGVANAEKDLAAGNYYAAAGSVIRMIPHIKAYGAATSDPIINRAMRVLALSTARAGGDFSKIKAEIPEELRAQFVGATADERKANLEWSVKALKALRKVKKNDATLASELGEAMAQLPEQHAKAKARLEKLANRDLLVSPEAYRALAVLRAEAGDEAGRTTALERCKNMAKDAGMCVAPSAAATGQS